MTTNVYILLDRSGSMGTHWAETLGTINGYIEGLAKAGHEGAVTLAAFDYAGPGFYSDGAGTAFEVVRKAVMPPNWTRLDPAEIAPRGSTPLYDAIGRICTLASADASPKGMIVIMTDGQENCSREVTRTGAIAALDRQRARGWDVIHLGVNFADVMAQAASVGTSFSKAAVMDSAAMVSGRAAEFMTRKTQAYATNGASASVISDEDRAALMVKKTGTTGDAA